MPPRQQYEVERIVAQRCRNKQTEYRVRWRGWRAADDTWESATTLQREVPTVVHSFLSHRALRGAFGRGCKPRRRCSRAAASVLVQAQARAAALPSSAHQELFDLMRRQFPATSSNDTAQIICESQCVLVMQHGHGHAVSAGACAVGAGAGGGTAGAVRGRRAAGGGSGVEGASTEGEVGARAEERVKAPSGVESYVRVRPRSCVSKRSVTEWSAGPARATSVQGNR